MEINGVSFEDWVAASANIANGMSGEEVCEILGIEGPVLAETSIQWGQKLGDLMTEDMSVATKYAEIFANPKVGKFANAGKTTNMGFLEKVPDYDTFVKITTHSSKASELGLDAGGTILEYGVTLQQWGQVGMYYSNWIKEKIHEENATPEELEMYNTADKKWETHFEEFYKDKIVDLGDDIDF